MERIITAFVRLFFSSLAIRWFALASKTYAFQFATMWYILRTTARLHGERKSMITDLVSCNLSIYLFSFLLMTYIICIFLVTTDTFEQLDFQPHVVYLFL